MIVRLNQCFDLVVKPREVLIITNYILIWNEILKMLSLVLLKRYNISLTLLFSSNFSQLKVSIVGLSNWVLVFLYSETNQIFKFNFADTIWWWQLGYNEAWTPLCMMKLLWLIKIRSMYAYEFGKICLGF